MMTMNSMMLICFIGGLLLGSIFYGGLWVTVKYGVQSKTPGLWFLVSFIARIAITLVGFYYLMDKQWLHLIICLAGFTIARFIITRLTQTINIKENER